MRAVHAIVAIASRFCIAMLMALLPALGHAATVNQSGSFNFTHTGHVDSGVISVAGTFTNTTNTSAAAINIPKFDPTLGTLTGVDVTFATTTSNYAIQPAGVLALILSASATRTFSYAITSGSAAGSGSNALTNSGGGMLTLLGLGNAEIGGAPLATTKSFSTAVDLAQFSGFGQVNVGLTASDAFTVTTLVSIGNGAGINGSGSYAGTVNVVYTYTPFTTVSGRVFQDNGAGAGTANDGIANGTEIGLGGRTLQLLDATNAVLDSTVSAADGTYRLYVPASVANGAVLRVQETNAGTWLSTGASVGTSSGTYSRSTDTLTWTFASGTSVTGVDFGDVLPSTLTANATQAGPPGSVLFYRHQFISASGGQVSFSTTQSSTPAVPGWSQVVYLDANQNGIVDASELPLSAPVTVTAGQVLNLIVKVAVPATAPFNARVQGTLQANVSYVNASPALGASLSVSEVTDVGIAANPALLLQKSVDKASAAPGTNVVYSVTFTNYGSQAVTNLVVNDTTPAYTSFVSASVTVSPSGLGTPVTAVPSVGASGAVKWSFPGQLAPNATGTVSFTVLVKP